MSQFARRLDAIDKYAELSTGAGPSWWRDLLSLWRPSGVAAGEYGLRLAIRDNKLNFYRRGQSIALVKFNREGIVTAKTHIKYVGKASLGPKYVVMRDDGRIFRGREEFASYQGSETLKEWIAVVDAKHAKGEKQRVDQLVTENPSVIDLEMGLPAWGEQKTAPRMDLIAIELLGPAPQVVFWEAKLVTDGRIRCRGDFVIDEKPEVLKQLAAYRRFLEAPGHADLVAKAYSNAARLMVRLREIADGCAEKHSLGGEILAAAAAPKLVVDRKPRLVVFNQKNARQTKWEDHARRLKEAGITMTVIEERGSFALGSPP
jgi:hypothetical protein